VGEKVGKDIGPAGGTISSSDGRLTLTVPENAVSENVAFSIQSTSNKVEDGIGSAYRVEPSGMTFKVPVTIAMKYSEQDIAAMKAFELKLAYQDETGVWHEKTSSVVDAEAGHVSVTTDHLSGWAVRRAARSFGVTPQRATVRVGRSINVQAEKCEQLEGYNRGERKCGGVDNCTWNLTGPGSISGSGTQVTYTAPSAISQTEVAKVSCTVNDVWPGWGKSVMVAELLIKKPVYSATGSSVGMTFLGTICSLEAPFVVYGQTQLRFQFNFQPGSPTSGNVSIGGGGMGITIGNGRGTYTIENADTDHPRIAVTGAAFTGTYGPASAQGGGTKYIDLVPLDYTGECVLPEQKQVPFPPDKRLQQKRGL
jgi:hypothetical protein